jgi:hypothetical protein
MSGNPVFPGIVRIGPEKVKTDNDSITIRTPIIGCFFSKRGGSSSRSGGNGLGGPLFPREESSLLEAAKKNARGDFFYAKRG